MTLEAEKTQRDFSKLPYTADPYGYIRRKTRVVMVGDVGVGGDNPIRVQSMTTADTLDTDSVVAETVRLVNVGCEIVRITTPTAKDSENLKNIRAALAAKGIKVPLVADIHFNPNAAMEAALWADKVRINPGNFADAKRFAVRDYTDVEYQKELQRIEEKFAPLVLRCKELGRSVRIGTNHGSLSDRIMNYFGDTPEGMVESAMEFAAIARKYDYHDLIFSMKASNPKVMIQAYRLLVAQLDELGWDYPMHLGVTEAGNGEDGRIKSAIGIGSLLEDGIGDTIRVSLTEDPEYEVPVAFRIARRYTPIDKTLLEKAGITDETPVALPSVGQPSVAGQLPIDIRDPYHYNKLSTDVVSVGSVKIGSDNMPVVIAELMPERIRELQHTKRELPVFGGKKRSTEAPTNPDIYLVSEITDEIKQLKATQNAKLPLLFNIPGDNNLEKAEAAAKAGVDGFYFEFFDDEDIEGVVEAVAKTNLPFFLMYSIQTGASFYDRHSSKSLNREIIDLLGYIQICLDANVRNLVVGLSTGSAYTTKIAYRLLAAHMQERGWKHPIHLVAPDLMGGGSAVADDYMIDGSIATGGLLTDGIGNSIRVGNSLNAALSKPQQIQLAYNILQAAGARSTKAEFIACPSCGRTLFDLQSTTERIKAQTGHLVGVKIAVMGCIVNGLGELADADFGYMGGAPGKVNLFVGKECVEKGVPTEQAVDRLVAIIKKHGRWIEQEEEAEV